MADILTPNIGLEIPDFNQPNWNVPLQYDLTLLDLIFGGLVEIPALKVLNLMIVNLNLTAAQVIDALGYTPLNPANNLADVDSTSQSLANLGGIGAGSVMGAWSNTTVYNTGNIVTYGGATYISKTGPQSGNEPDTSPTYWTVFIPSQSAIYGEAPAGAFPGNSYTLSFDPSAIVGIWYSSPNPYNAVLLLPTQYSRSGTTITLGFETKSGDSLWAIYYH